jgi:ligand-binding sensor domain-containing protein/two-component sensor histidine kinase
LVGFKNYAQHPSYWQLTDEQGLPSTTVFDLHQDIKGYIWMATESGLCRYDGSKFKFYKAKTSKASAVSHIQEDGKSRIWFVNFSGQLFYIEQEKTYEYKFPKGLPDFLSYHIDKQDRLFTYHNDMVWYLHTQGKAIPLFKGYDQMVEYAPNSFINLDTYDVIFYQNGNLLKKNNGREVKKIGMSYRHQIIKNWHIVVERALDEIFILNDQAEKPLQKSDKINFIGKKNPSQKTIELNDVRPDKDDNIWFLTYSGLYGYSQSLEPLFVDSQGKPQPLFVDKPISDIVQDREGNYWISTLSDGVFVMPNKDILFFNEFNMPSLEDKHIYKIAKDDEDNLLLGMFNGKVKVFNTYTKQITYEYITKSKKEIEALAYDKENKKLFVSCSMGFYFDKNGKECYNLKGATSAPKYFSLYKNSVFTAGADGIGLGAWNDLGEQQRQQLRAKFDYIKNTTEFNYNSFFMSTQKRSRAVFVEKDQSKVWLGYAHGLFLFENMKVREFKWNDSVSVFVKCFAQKDDILIVGTLTQGLMFFKGTKPLKQISNLNGLPSNLCSEIYVDENTLWVATDKGLAKVSLSNYEVEVFNRQDGLISEQINGVVVVNNHVWLASPKGLMKIPKNLPSKNVIPPQIYIDKLLVWETPLPFKSNYVLNYQENNLKIDFQGITYKGRGSFRYKYKMVGIDTNWIYTESSNNFARYPSLPSGKYEFQVKAINEDGVESEGTAILQIEIATPFWKKIWFIVASILAFIAIVALIVWWRLKLIQRKNTIERSLRESQLAALKVQMNPHFIFNALNSIQEFILLNEKRLANEFLGKFSDLMRLTLDMSNEQEIPLQDEIKMLDLYLQLEAIRFENLQYHLEVDKSLDIESIQIPSMIIQPYIENALKHGLLHKKDDRKLRVRFSQKDDFLQCEIEDNGIGRKKSGELNKNRPKKHKSFAISATQKRLDLLNYGRKKAIKSEIIDLYNNSEESLGTKIILNIPI